MNAALRARDLEAASAAGLDPKERALLEFTQLQTLSAYKIHDGSVQKLRDVGWTDEQIMEGTFIGAIFNFFVRMADAFGLADPEYDKHPEEVERMRRGVAARIPPAVT